MTIVREKSDGSIEPIYGNPTLTSLDGTMRAPLRAILSPSWDAKERERFGIYETASAEIPDGKRAVGDVRYERRSGEIVQVVDVENVPEPTEDARSAIEKMEQVCASIGITLDEMRAVILGSKS